MAEPVPTFRVVTWNVHACRGRDGRHDVERVGECVRAFDADIAAFQEVDSRARAGGRRDIHDYLREQIGDHGEKAWALSGADGDYGQVLASRYPLTDWQIHDISVAGCEPRKIMDARVVLPGGSIRVIATHLGLRWRERRRQMRRLREIVRTDLAGPVLLLGDFNQWHVRRHPRWALSDLFDQATTLASFPSRYPMLALDRILCRQGLRMSRSWVARTARLASDHLPVLADLAVAAAR